LVGQCFEGPSFSLFSQTIISIKIQLTFQHHVNLTIIRPKEVNVLIFNERTFQSESFKAIVGTFTPAGVEIQDVFIHWHFLAGDAQTIDALSENLGFLFFPSAKGFDHLAQTTVVDRNGTIYRQLYGVDLDTPTLVEPLKELVFDTPRSAGLIDHWVSTFKLFCTVYDPNSDRYRFDYSIFMTIAVGLLCLGAIATFVIREWRHAQ